MPILRRRTQSATTAQPAGSGAVPSQRDTAEGATRPESAEYGETESRRAYGGSAEPRADDKPRHYGMAGTLMTLSGLLTFFVGITGIIRGIFFNTVATYPFYFSVRSRGITLLVIGAIAFVVGLALLVRMQWARHIATVVAVASAVANFMFLPFYPFWSIVVLILDVIVIWELTRERGSREYAHLRCVSRASLPQTGTWNRFSPSREGEADDQPAERASPVIRAGPTPGGSDSRDHRPAVYRAAELGRTGV